MQLHPAEAEQAVRHAVESLAASFIGLDFGADVGDLKRIRRDKLPPSRRDYWSFAHEMKVGDRVVIIVHHFPFALVRVAGAYNYTREVSPELGIWFRHFRRVDDVRFYGDFVTNAHEWKTLPMTETITRLRDPHSLSYKLIAKWSKAA
jgi:hypothetical protein